MHHRLSLPSPWHSLDFFELVEPVRETETEIFYRKHLYMVSPSAKGGKVLIRCGQEQAAPKMLPTDGQAQQ